MGPHIAHDDIVIRRVYGDFGAWSEVLALIQRSFAYMDGVIDPPSSALRLTPEGLRQKAVDEAAFVAFADDVPVGCVFLADRGDRLYLGKLAVDPDLQGRGIGRMLLVTAERHADELGRSTIELQTRIELVDNHATFRKSGYRETGRSAHAGYDRPTTLTFMKELDVGRIAVA